MFENYLLKDFKNHAADLGPVLVDTCFYLFFNLVLSRPLVGVLLVLVFHFLTRKNDVRMRNDISSFIQDSKQHSLLPYHLFCMAAEYLLLQSILPPYLPKQHKIVLLFPCHLKRVLWNFIVINISYLFAPVAVILINAVLSSFKELCISLIPSRSLKGLFPIT